MLHDPVTNLIELISESIEKVFIMTTLITMLMVMKLIMMMKLLIRMMLTRKVVIMLMVITTMEPRRFAARDERLLDRSSAGAVLRGVPPAAECVLAAQDGAELNAEATEED